MSEPGNQRARKSSEPQSQPTGKRSEAGNARVRGKVAGEDQRARNRELASPHQRYDARLQRRSSSMLQQRVVEQERASIAEALNKILADDSIAQAAARIVAARR